MSRHDDGDDGNPTGPQQSTDVSALTRRQLMQVVGGSLLGSSVIGTTADISRASVPADSDPSPGEVDWAEYVEDPQVVGENVEPPHSPATMPYASLRAARDAEHRREFLTDQWIESEYVKSLNGAWKFHFAEDLDAAVAETSGFQNWDAVYLPHSWNMDGYGDLEYHASGTGFEPNDPPSVPSSDNSVGTYKREFTVPTEWTTGRQTFLKVSAAKSGYFVWVNGSYVGYKQGSMTPGEFNVTDALEPGATNTVTIQVLRWTDGTYLEQQDMWRFAGIFRDVLLYSKPDVCVRDLNTVTGLDETYTDGTLTIDAAVANHSDDRKRQGRGPPSKGDDGPSRSGPPKENGSSDNPGQGRGPPENTDGIGRPQQHVTLRARLYDPSGTEVRTAKRELTVRPGEVVSLDDSPDDAVKDMSREANDATIHGDPEQVDGVYGNSLRFDGNDDWADAGSDDSLDVTDTVTVEAIVSVPKNAAKGTVPIVAKGNQYALHIREGAPEFNVHDGSNRQAVTADSSEDWTDEWHRITGVYDGSELRLYVDGSEVATASHSGGIGSTDERVTIARESPGSDTLGDVAIDSARIYDRPLSAGEIETDRTLPSHSSRLWIDFDGIQSGSAAPITMEIPDVDTWAAEDPSLYTLGIELVPKGSDPYEALIDKIGFRTVEIAEADDDTGDTILVNGEQITLTGTNRHSLGLDHGRHAPLERVRKEIELAKRHNVNALRTSHYPARIDFYRLADEYGIYVQDEINAEAHGNQSLVNDDYRFDPSFFDRFYRMVERDKNFASINVWSTGNEAGEGPAHEFMADYVDERDGTRLLTHQDNGGGYGAGFGGTAPFANINGIRWSIPEDIAAMAGDDGLEEPIVMGEYAPVEGNAAGLLPDFGDVIYEYDQVVGGYIWMYNHHSLNSTKNPDDDGVLSDPHRRAAVDDQSIAGQTAMIRGTPETTTGPSGTALDLDGDGDWVDADDDDRIDLTGDLTVEAVIDGETPADGYQPIVTKGDSQFALRFRDGDLEFALHDGSTDQTVSAPLPGDWSGSWHTVTGVYDGSELRLYVDGTELVATPVEGRIQSNRYRVGIGHNTEKTDRYADITVDSVRLFDRALGEGEIDAAEPDESTRLWLDFEVKEHFWSSPYGTDHSAPSGTIHDDRYTLPTIDVMKKSYQFVRFSATDLTEGAIDVSNRYHFTALEEFDVEWELKQDNTVIQSGSLELDTAPGETETVEVGFDEPPLEAGSDYFLDVSVTRATDAAWASAGYEVAFEQFEIPWEVPEGPEVTLAEIDAVSYTDQEPAVVVSGTDFTYVFDRNAGRFTSFQRHGEELLASGPQLNAWREPVRPNETSGWGHTEADDFVAAGLDEMTASVETVAVSQPDESAVRIDVETVDSADGNDAEFSTTYRYHVLGSGDVVARVTVEPNAEMITSISSYLPRLGLQLRVADRFDNFEWYGRGAGESYPDKKWHQRVGRYSGPVADQFEPYLPPGDYGNKCDTRYAALTDDSGVGLLVHGLAGTKTMDVSVQEFTDMWEADHHYQLESADGIVFNVDYGVSGVGGIPNGTRPPYQINPTFHEFVYAFRPFDSASRDPVQLSKRRLPFSGSDDGGKESGPIQDGNYWLENVNSGNAVDVSADDIDQNGANVLQWEYWGSGNQQWTTIQNADDSYRFVNVDSSKVLTVTDGSTESGADVVQWDWNGDDEQRWQIVKTGDETYRIENVNSGHALGITDGSSENGADVVQMEWAEEDHQQWYFNQI